MSTRGRGRMREEEEETKEVAGESDSARPSPTDSTEATRQGPREAPSMLTEASGATATSQNTVTAATTTRP